MTPFRYTTIHYKMYSGHQTSYCCFCPVTDAAGVTFDGDSRITYDVSGTGQYVQSYDDRLKLRFRTTQADGLVFFADGNQGDYIVLELVNGKLYFHIDLGKSCRLLIVEVVKDLCELCML